MSLQSLKSRSGNISRLQEQLAKLKSKKNDDEVYWKLGVDKATGIGSATIRLLPEAEGEDRAFVPVIEYGIKGKGGWYINRSLKTLGQPDPVDDEYWALINQDTDASKKAAKELSRKQVYIAYIYVIKDKVNPQNEGKVMKAKFTPSIWKLIENKITPIHEDDAPCDVFDLWEGANFVIRASNGDNGLRTYADSKWSNNGPLDTDEERLEEIYTQIKPLSNEIDPENKIYGKYDKLAERLEKVLGRPLISGTAQTDTTLDEAEAELQGAFKSEESNYKPTPKPAATVTSDDDDELALMLAED